MGCILFYFIFAVEWVDVFLQAQKACVVDIFTGSNCFIVRIDFIYHTFLI